MDHPQTPDQSVPLTPAPTSPTEVAANGPADHASTTPSDVDKEPNVPADLAPPPPLSLTAWLASNGIYILIFAICVGLLYRSYGIDGIIRAVFVMLGLGFVIFIHELGHFLAAKWCDVHVKTFSIGFGPAIPGCSFQWGETTYKIAILPLGGYVHMVGEMPEGDDAEESPRSFRNKTVGQRMLIISAGVIMNVLLGAACFAITYQFHGVPRPPAEIWRVDPGSPAWEKEVRSGWRITQLSGNNHPFFDDLKMAVAFTGHGEGVGFTFATRELDSQGNPITKTFTIVPRRDANDISPVIGVLWPQKLELLPPVVKQYVGQPVIQDSAAADARVVDLKPGDKILAATDLADAEKVTELPEDPRARTIELARRLQKWKDREVVLKVRHQDGEVEEKKLPPGGFEFDDRVIATSDPDKNEPFDPFQVSELPQAPGGAQGDRDWYEYRKRMRRMASEFVVLRVVRGGKLSTRTVDLLVPPEYHRVLPGRVGMRMGEIAGVPRGEPVKTAARVINLRPGDEIVAATDLEDPKKVTDLPTGKEERSRALAERLRKWAGQPMVIRVRHKDGSVEQKTLAGDSGRVVDSAGGDEVVAATDLEDPSKVTDLPTGKEERAKALAERLRKWAGRPVVVKVRHKDGTEEEKTLAVEGFRFDDRIIATTDPEKNDLFAVKELRSAVSGGPGERDWYEFRQRMRLLADRFTVLRVVRQEGDEQAEVDLLVPPDVYRVPPGPICMQMGEVAGVRENSAAREAGVQKGDILEKITVEVKGQPPLTFDLTKEDPARLPFELAQAIKGQEAEVAFTVSRCPENSHPNRTSVPLTRAVKWDPSWADNDEVPLSPYSPMSIPQLGVAYWVDSTVAVGPEGSDNPDELKKNDQVRAIAFWEMSRTDVAPEWSTKTTMKSDRGPNRKETYDQWAYYFTLAQRSDFPRLKLTVQRDGASRDIEAALQRDHTWPAEDRGIRFVMDVRLQRSENLVQAVQFGMEKTWTVIKQVWLTLTSMASGRISPKAVGGPIEIASQAFSAAGENFVIFLLFLGIISVNLAVINFLPIPVLDGGHMVFLIYEKLRGRPPSETVQAVATYIGLALILSLMVFVFYQDIVRFFKWQ